MTETMVRTQVYLPRKVYDELRARAKAHRLTIAMQIREALEEYIQRAKQAEDEGILQPDDPIFQLAGVFGGPSDLSANHDSYLYGAPKGRLPTETGKAATVKERPSAVYVRRSLRRRKPKKRRAAP